MIAPIQQREPPAEVGGIRRARRLVADRLLADDDAQRNVARVKPWQAWALVGWIVVTTAVYAASMAGLLR